MIYHHYNGKHPCVDYDIDKFCLIIPHVKVVYIGWLIFMYCDTLSFFGISLLIKFIITLHGNASSMLSTYKALIILPSLYDLSLYPICVLF